MAIDVSRSLVRVDLPLPQVMCSVARSVVRFLIRPVEVQQPIAGGHSPLACHKELHISAEIGVMVRQLRTDLKRDAVRALRGDTTPFHTNKCQLCDMAVWSDMVYSGYHHTHYSHTNAHTHILTLIRRIEYHMHVIQALNSVAVFIPSMQRHLCSAVLSHLLVYIATSPPGQ